MDTLSFVGIGIALAAVLGGNALEGGNLAGLYNAPALLIVLGGSLGAILLQYPWSALRTALRQTIWIFRPRHPDLEAGAQEILGWNQRVRRQGLLGLDGLTESHPEAFCRRGLQLLIDGTEPRTLRHVLELDLENWERSESMGGVVYEALGGYTPTLGILGAVLGLIHVMGNLADPSKLGPGIATAFVATIYGVGFANLFFFPIAQKLRQVVQQRVKYREMMIEGLLSIAEGENATALEHRLAGFRT